MAAADHYLKARVDLIQADPKGGQDHAHVQRQLAALAGLIQDRMVGIHTIDSVNLGVGESFIGQFIAPYDLEIMEIRAVKQASSGSVVTATLVNRDAAANSDKNPLTAASVDMDGLTTANESEAQTLSGTETNYQMKAGDVCKCTFAADGASTLTGGGLSIKYKPVVALS